MKSDVWPVKDNARAFLGIGSFLKIFPTSRLRSDAQVAHVM